MRMHCEYCGVQATHVCEGPNMGSIYFCEDHGKEHEAHHKCGGTLRKLLVPEKRHWMSDDSR
jgi:hypothetical protein